MILTYHKLGKQNFLFHHLAIDSLRGSFHQKVTCSCRLRSCGLDLILHEEQGERYDTDVVLRKIACFYIEFTKFLRCCFLKQNKHSCMPDS